MTFEQIERWIAIFSASIVAIGAAIGLPRIYQSVRADRIRADAEKLQSEIAARMADEQVKESFANREMAYLKMLDAATAQINKMSDEFTAKVTELERQVQELTDEIHMIKNFLRQKNISLPSTVRRATDQRGQTKPLRQQSGFEIND